MRKIAQWLATLMLATTMLAACGDGGSAGQSPFGSAASPPPNGGGNPPDGGSSGSFVRSGAGDDSFTLPATVGIVRISATYAGTAQNFIVYAGATPIVNEIVGSEQLPAAHDGVYAVTPGARLEIRCLAGVQWRVASETLPSVDETVAFQKSGSGDRVFDLPARLAAYRIQGSYAGAGSNFVVQVNGERFVNEILGTSWPKTEFVGTFTLPASGRVEITNSSGVNWSFSEQP